MNATLFLLINSYANHNYIFDSIGIALAQGTIYLFIIFEIYIYFGLKQKNEAIFAFYSMLVGLAINQIIGLFYFHNRPFMDNLGIAIIHHSIDNSFPSDHTTFMMSIAISLFFYKNTKIWGNWLFMLALLGGISRVFTGVHYPFDIIGSVFTATFGALIVFVLKNKLQKINNTIFVIENMIFKGIKSETPNN